MSDRWWIEATGITLVLAGSLALIRVARRLRG